MLFIRKKSTGLLFSISKEKEFFRSCVVFAGLIPYINVVLCRFRMGGGLKRTEEYKHLARTGVNGRNMLWSAFPVHVTDKQLHDAGERVENQQKHHSSI